MTTIAEARQVHQAGDLDRAELLYRQVLQADPDHAEAHLCLAEILRQQGHTDEAESHLRKARLAQDLALARRYHQSGDTGLAEQLYRQILPADPENAELFTCLGLLCEQTNRPDEAVTHYRQAIRLRPTSGTAYLNLANLLQRRDDLEGAADCLREAVRRLPHFARARLLLGNFLYGLGQFEEAAEQFREAVRLVPGFAEAHTNLGATLLSLGKVDEAAAHFRQALHHDPADVRALLNLAEHGLYSAAEPGVNGLEAWLREPRLDRDVALQLHFTLGYVLDRAGKYDAAFVHFRQGNALRRAATQFSGLAFDPAKHSRETDRLIATFSPEYFRRVQGFGPDAELPVFVVGMPRSGTTLVEQILSCHPQVFAAGELQDLRQIVAGLPARLRSADAYPECLAGIDAAMVQEMAAAHLRRLSRLGGSAERVTDKMPDNFLRLGLVATLLPRARVIHCRRDARDVCLSCFSHLLNQPFAWDLEDLGRYYRDYERLMAHWRAVLPLPVLAVDYEDLVADPERVSRRLVEFCGLPWDDRCLKSPESRRPVATASRVQVRQPVYTTAVGRWRRYAAHLRPFLLSAGFQPDAER